MMKRKWRLLIIIVIAISLAFATRAFFLRRAERERQGNYEAVLGQYSKTLKPGMSRLDVESYLKSNGDTFQRICCLKTPRHAFADIIKIGQEPTPWYCNRYNVYVGLEFERIEWSDAPTDSRNSDRLESVRLFPHLEECL